MRESTRSSNIQTGILVEWLSIAWMVVEAAAAASAGWGFHERIEAMQEARAASA